MQKRWLVKTPKDITTVEEFRSTLKIDRIVAELLLQRGIHTYEQAENFFRPKLDQLHDPFLMKDLTAAVERVNQAIQKKERILLFGDYDVDGTTAVALLYTVLRKHYQQVDFYIPDRYSEGYGISYTGIDFASFNNFSLIISLDCGIRSVDHVRYAKEKGIDFEEIVLGKEITTKTLQAVTGSTTVPQVFIDGKLIGGSEDLANYFATT